MRIISGVAKGRRVGFRKAFLRQGEADELRPTSSKVREAVFDIIRDELPGAEFLDLYAGTGGVGIEALSRGAGKVTFVESNALRVKMINDLIMRFNFKGRSVVIMGDTGDFLKKELEKRHKYDIIFLDPPYHSGELMTTLQVIGQGGLLEEDGTVIAEHFSKTVLPDVTGMLKLVKKYRYGDTALTRYRLEKT